jgi:hypothetical protein
MASSLFSAPEHVAVGEPIAANVPRAIFSCDQRFTAPAKVFSRAQPEQRMSNSVQFLDIAFPLFCAEPAAK